MTTTTIAPNDPEESTEPPGLSFETRRATGQPSWPCVLLEGGEKAGKTDTAAELAKSDRFSRRFWIPWGVEAPDDYDHLEDIVPHDGSFNEVGHRVREIHGYARTVLDAGDKPVLLVIDNMSAAYDALKEWANSRVITSPSAQRKIDKDPGASIEVPQHVKSQINASHGRLMRLLLTFSGVVVLIARGSESPVFGDNGPTGQTTYRIDGHWNLASDVSCWIRLSRDAPPTVIGARAPATRLRPGIDRPRRFEEGIDLEHIVFDVLLRGATAGQVRDYRPVATAS